MTELAEAPATTSSGEPKRITHWISGAAVPGRSGRSGPVFNPATGVQSGVVDFASPEEVDAAVQAAKAAFPAWRAARCRGAPSSCSAFASLSTRAARTSPRLLTLEHGKVLSDAMGEVARGLENIEFACGIPTLMKGGFSEQASTGVDVYSIRQPLGVVAGITPFNFPAMVPMWMLAPALACGNCFVLKPSEKDPSASLFTGRAAEGGRRPRRRLQRRSTATRSLSTALLEHPDVAAVSFVGSTPIARSIYETGTTNGKRVQALGGAKNHMVVLPDADLDMAADAAVSAAYGSAGERCMAISVVVAVGDVADELVERDQGAPAEDQGRRRHGPRVRDGPARHARAPRQGRLVHRPGRGAGRHGRRRRPRDARPTATASSSAPRCSTT